MNARQDAFPEDRGLTALATRRPVGVTMIALSVVVFGWISFQLLPRNLMPDISFPSVTVRTEYPGAAPIDVEMRVSRRLEEVLSQVRGLRRVSSMSRSEVSDVILEFAWGTDMSLATAEVRERASQALLPDDVGQSTLLRYDPTLDPFLQIGLYRKNDSYADREESLIALRIFAEEELEQALESIPGVAGVRVRGGLEKEIQVDVDEDALRAKRVSIGLVAQRLRDENLNQASGILYEGDQARTVRTVNEFQSLEEMRDVVLRRDETVPIRLRDVADVHQGFAEPDVITRIDGRPCVKIDFYKEADANVVEVARRVRERVFGSAKERAIWARIQAEESSPGEKEPSSAESGAGGANGDDDENDDDEDEDGDGASSPAGMRGAPRPTFLATRLPEELELVVLSDQSVFVEDALEDVRQTAIVGGALAVIVLLFFLKRIWFTIAVALAIPISVLATWIVMHMTGVSLNMMSLGGLALGIGMLVDSSIVVLESIFRFRERGDAPRRAAVRGTAAVALAVTASTLTTVAVFFPIVFVEGVAGRIFRDQALTVVISLLASLAVSLWLIPALVCRGFERRAETAPGRSPVRRLLRNARPRPLADLRAAVAALPWRGALAIASALVLPLVALWSVVASIVRAFSWLGLASAWGAASMARKLGRGAGPWARGAGRGVGYLFDRGFGIVRDTYDRALRFGLSRRGVVIAITLVVTIASFALVPRLDTELIPKVHQGEFTVRVRLPRSTRIEGTDRLIDTIERRIRESKAPALREIESITTTVGLERDELGTGDEGPYSARLHVRLRPGPRLREREEAAQATLRELVRDPAIDAVEIVQPVLFSFRTPIEVEVTGEDLDELHAVATDVETRLRDLPLLADVRSTVAPGNPEVQVEHDREVLWRYDLHAGSIGSVVRSKVLGDIASWISEGDRRVPIRVRLRETDRDSLGDLRDIAVHDDGSLQLRLRDVVRARGASATDEQSGLRIGEGPAEIRRIDHQRAAVIQANLVGMSLGAATDGIERALADARAVSSDVTIGFGGQKEEMDLALGSLRQALLLAIFLVYVVMAIQFESLIQPLVILVSIPLALVGVIPVLWALSVPISIIVFIGMIVLAGIVVNNAIVLVDTANRFRREGLDATRAFIDAGRVRLRPILMTTLTTVLGLLPMTGALAGLPLPDAITGGGQGEEIRAPLAITVVVGLAASTLLTLVVVPVVASLVAHAEERVKRWWRAGERERGEEAAL